jgi:Na+-transporting methylmalonyl-CoA/oxaloacetate decarboxylase beta subunit
MLDLHNRKNTLAALGAVAFVAAQLGVVFGLAKIRPLDNLLTPLIGSAAILVANVAARLFWVERR